jgi:ribose transport system permease protein
VLADATREPDAMSGARGGEDRAGSAGVAIGLRLLSFGPIVILVLLILAISLLTPNFLKPVNIGNILAQTAVIAIVAMGQQLVILTRGIDLSVGANLALATVIGGLVFRVSDSAFLVILAMLATGTLVGLVNGAVYVFGRLPHPFIITLATLSICRGLALELSVNHTTMRGMPAGVNYLGETSSLGVPNSFFVVFGVALLVLVMMKAMVWGRWTYAVGGNPKAALEMGILGHALVGALMIGVIRNALNLLNVDVFYQMIAIGLIIVVAVEADVLRTYLEGRARMNQTRAQ